ncbi:hypothetical protein BZA05DRAFT_442271 [Tricharina praecox]|uniref:uncharacterized protein n=1 Tax=Tricharina praecox TaxID=43433 RepID=UPI00221FB73A|nr:uncharacterized protein BZA05DRAFT_442271 [Tricharina praecox]KAI5856590.1 hypothetical protein BZA05DRAFT_442271 [Tricharina praecox]
MADAEPARNMTPVPEIFDVPTAAITDEPEPNKEATSVAEHNDTMEQGGAMDTSMDDVDGDDTPGKETQPTSRKTRTQTNPREDLGNAWRSVARMYNQYWYLQGRTVLVETEEVKDHSGWSPSPTCAPAPSRPSPPLFRTQNAVLKHFGNVTHQHHKAIEFRVAIVRRFREEPNLITMPLHSEENKKAFTNRVTAWRLWAPRSRPCAI